MKRDSRAWLADFAALSEHDGKRDFARDIIDSDKKQRATIADLKAQLADAEKVMEAARRGLRELHRWQHGGQVEGDYICEPMLQLDEANIVIERGSVELRKAQKRIEELEANIDRSVCQDAEGERIHFGARVVCGQCFGSQEQHLKNARAEMDTLRALVSQHPEQLRRVAEEVRSACCVSDLQWPTMADLDAIIAEATKP